MDNEGLFSEIRALFSISKKGQGRPSPLPPNCPPEYPWISLNILENTWITVLPMPGLSICLITLHVWQAFENASGSKCARVLNMPQLHVQELHRVPNMSGNTSICLNNAWICLNNARWICLNMAEYCWMSLYMSQNAWINCFNNACVLYASSS